MAGAILPSTMAAARRAWSPGMSLAFLARPVTRPQSATGWARAPFCCFRVLSSRKSGALVLVQTQGRGVLGIFPHQVLGDRGQQGLGGGVAGPGGQGLPSEGRG